MGAPAFKSSGLDSHLTSQEVVRWVQLVLARHRNPLPASEVGIVAPYRRQVQKLRKALEKQLGSHVAAQIKVGSVDEFQGQARRSV